MKITDFISSVFSPKKKGRVIIITGCAGVGKSAISSSLGKKLKKCYYISVDDLREKVISGYEFPAKMKWNKETYLQSSLARISALCAAKLYSDNGFDVVVDDTIYGENVDLWLDKFSPGQIFVFCLYADLSTVIKRNRMRQHGRLPDKVIRYLFVEFENFKNKYHSVDGVVLVDNQNSRLSTINKIFDALT